MFRIISIAIAALVLGGCASGLEGDWDCYERKYKKATDLSTVKVGASRADIEKALGLPIAKRDVKDLYPPLYKVLAVYQYDLGPAESVFKERWWSAPVYAGRVRRGSKWVEFCPPADKQKRLFLLVYDGDNRVVRREPSFFVPYLENWAHEVGLSRKDLMEYALLWDNKPAETYDHFGIMPTRRHQDYWLCLNVQNQHAWALREMGRRYWKGEKVARRDKVLGYMWYSLATRADPAYANKQKERKRSLTPAQHRRAQQLAAGWKPDKKSCDALPGW